jgi:hypothetical protein
VAPAQQEHDEREREQEHDEREQGHEEQAAAGRPRRRPRRSSPLREMTLAAKLDGREHPAVRVP